MRLTELMFGTTRAIAQRRFGLRKFPKGNIFIGKHKVIKQVTPLAIAEQRRLYGIEEQNMFYVRHPYLPYEVSKGHMQALYDAGLKEHYVSKKIRENKEHWKRTNVTLEESLVCLKNGENWDI